LPINRSRSLFFGLRSPDYRLQAWHRFIQVNC